MENPYSPPQLIELGTDATLISPRDYGGIGRIAFVGIMIGVWAAISFLDAEIIAITPGGLADVTSGLLLLVVLFAACAYRLKNVGSSPWLCLLLCVPIANLLVGIRCLVCQEGYGDTKKLDTAGGVLASGVVVLLILIVVFSFLSF